jgi:hypothetical protein
MLSLVLHKPNAVIQTAPHPCEFKYARYVVMLLRPSFTALLRSSVVLLPCACEHFFLHLEQLGFAQPTRLHLVDTLFTSL